MLSKIYSLFYGKYSHKVLGGLVLLMSMIGGFLLAGFSPIVDGVQAQSWGDYETKNCKGESEFGFGLCAVARIVGKENKETGIITTKIDHVDRNEGDFAFEPSLKITNTLSSIKIKLATYLERMAFIGLSASVALLIYNGLVLILSPLTEDQAGVVKKRIGYILMGVLLITGFYFVLKVLLSVVVDIIRK